MLRSKFFAITSLAMVPSVGPLLTERLSPTVPALSLPQEASPDRAAIDAEIAEAARDNRVDARLVQSIVAAESGFDHTAKSWRGAIGLMQLKPETAAALGFDATDWDQNIEAGTRYLQSLLQRYRHRKDGLLLAIAAYNAGPGNVDRYGAVPPFPETRTYVRKVLSHYKRLQNEDAAEVTAD